jgi:hypothetical protein
VTDVANFEIRRFSVDELQESPEVADHLARDGFVVIKQFFGQGEVERLNAAVNEIEELIKRPDQADPALKVVEKRLNYAQLAASTVTSVDVRGRGAAYDGGMVDVFNPRLWLKERHPELDAVLDRLKSAVLLNLVQGVDHRLQPRNTNIYIHNAVTNPRVAHVDANRDFFKIFLALTNHGAQGCGPLLVYPGSHRRRMFNRAMCFYNSKLRLVNGVLNVDDASFYDARNMVPLLMEPGDMALCNQSIVHSAMPASPTGYRRTFVQVFDIPRGQN